jgi:SpoIIAA-like
MSIELQEKNGGKTLEVVVSGKLDKDDYDRFVPEVERLIRQHKKISVLFEMHDFHGWKAGALWEDIKFDAKHFSDIERLAMVGNKDWEKWMSIFCRPFTAAQIRYFEHEQLDQARAWIAAESSPVAQ